MTYYQVIRKGDLISRRNLSQAFYTQSSKEIGIKPRIIKSKFVTVSNDEDVMLIIDGKLYTIDKAKIIYDKLSKIFLK